MWMFENRPISANIPQIEYEKICDVNIREHNNGENILKKDFLIGNYFKLVKHCEGIGEYSCAMKSHFRKSGNQMSGKWKSSYASLLA